MGVLDYVLIGIIAAWFVLSLVFIFKKKKSGGCAGCSGCSSGSGCSACQGKDAEHKCGGDCENCGDKK